MDSNPIDAKILLTAIALLVAAEAATAILAAELPFDPLLLLGLLRLIEAALLTTLVVRWGRGAASIGLNPAKWRIGLKKGLIWSAAFGLAAGIGLAVLRLAGLSGLELVRSPLPREPMKLAIFLAVGGVVGPVAEEVFFRGILFGFFRRWGKWTAVILSSMIFVAFHRFNAFPLPQAVGGVVFALAYEASQSLLAPITIHVLGNLSLFSLSMLAYHISVHP